MNLFIFFNIKLNVKKIQEKLFIEQEKWEDRPMKLFVMKLGKFFKKETTLEGFFSQYDEDFSGYLCP